LLKERHSYDVFDQMRTDGVHDATMAHYAYDHRKANAWPSKI